MEDLNELLKRYKNGTCTEAERIKLESWYDSVEQQGIWPWSEEDKARIKSSLKRGIDKAIQPEKNVFRLRIPLWSAAAVLLLIISAAVFFFRADQNPVPTERSLSFVERSVPAGKTAKFTLSDGSTVTVNGSSKIRFPEEFTGKERQVYLLEGEAFFDIRHNEQKPFLVRVNNLTVRVLGTAFNVKSYQSLEDLQVTVSRGKVAVEEPGLKNNGNPEILLVKDEQVSINKQSLVVSRSHVNAQNIAGWTAGRFVFDNETLAEIAYTIHYARGINFRFADESVKDIRCSAQFDRSDSAEDIVFALSKANGLVYSINNDVITFRKAAN